MCGAGCVSNLPKLYFIDQSAQLVGRGYHLFSPLVRQYCSSQLLREFKDLHEAAHTVEHVLHPFYLIGDIIQLNRIMWNTQVRQKFMCSKNLLKRIATILHTMSHLIITLDFCQRMRFFSVPGVSKISPLTPAIHALALSLLLVDHFFKKEKIKKIGKTGLALLSQFSYISVFEKIPYISTLSEVSGLINALLVLRKGIHSHSH